MASERMTSVTKGVGALMHERRYFEVPAHQRDYAWPLAVVEQFFKDIAGALDRGDDEYFIGLIVIVDTDDPNSIRFRILDGQQRLATTTMIYSAIRHWLSANGEDKDSRKVQDEFIGVSEYGETDPDPRLVMNVENRSAFQEVVVGFCDDSLIAKRKQSAGRHSSTRKLLDAMERCRILVRRRAEAAGDEKAAQARALTELTKYIRDQVQVTCLHVASPEYAYIIFESLNDRGIDLSVLDLVKNHIFEKAGTSKEVQVGTGLPRSGW